MRFKKKLFHYRFPSLMTPPAKTCNPCPSKKQDQPRPSIEPLSSFVMERARRSTAGKRKWDDAFAYDDKEIDAAAAAGSQKPEKQASKKARAADVAEDPPPPPPPLPPAPVAPPAAAGPALDAYAVAARDAFLLDAADRLIKASARATFLLSSKDLDSVESEMEWPRPFHKWNKPMFFYNVGDCREVCLAKHGSEAGLANALRKNGKARAKREKKLAAVAEALGPRCKVCRGPTSDEDDEECWYGCADCCSAYGEKGCRFHDPGGGWAPVDRYPNKRWGRY